MLTRHFHHYNSRIFSLENSIKNQMHDCNVYEALFPNCEIHGSWVSGLGQYGHTCMYIILTIISSLLRDQGEIN